MGLCSRPGTCMIAPWSWVIGTGGSMREPYGVSSSRAGSWSGGLIWTVRLIGLACAVASGASLARASEQGPSGASSQGPAAETEIAVTHLSPECHSKAPAFEGRRAFRRDGR